MASGAERYCPHCWCALCEVRAAECTEWPSHCSTTEKQASDKRKAAKVAAVQSRLTATPRPPPPPHNSQANLLKADPRWHAMRFTALSCLEQFGHDIEGAMAAIAATHEVAIETTRQVLAALEAFGDVISLDGELHVRPGTNLNEPPPPPPPLPSHLAAAFPAGLPPHLVHLAASIGQQAHLGGGGGMPHPRPPHAGGYPAGYPSRPPQR